MNWNAIEKRLRERPTQLPGQARASAVLALIAGDRLVLEVRARSLRRQPGEICLPGGRIEPGETPLQAALRETREELGLAEAQIQPVGSLGVLLHSDRQVVYPILAHGPAELPEQARISPAEVEQMFTVPLDWFRENPPRPYQYQRVFTGLEAVPPQMARWLTGYPALRKGVYWQYEDKLIWGLTARIVTLVLEAVRPEPEEER